MPPDPVDPGACRDDDRREIEILARKVRYYLAPWEADRFATYILRHPAGLAAAIRRGDPEIEDLL